MASAKAAWRSDALGEGKALELPQGTIRYHETGSGPTVVFVHGALINANLWRKVVPRLASDMRCVTLDLPWGAHAAPMPPDADLTPPAAADIILDAIEALDLRDVTLVGNDTGGALCQIAVTRRPDRIGQLVLTSCDAFENFPPRVVKYFEPIIRMPGGIQVFMGPLRVPALRKPMLRMMFKAEIEREVQDSYVLPPLESAGVRRDIKKLIRGIDKRYTLEAAEKLRSFDRPTLVAWSTEDKFFPGEYAERLAAAIPDARLEWIEDSFTFSPEDQPARVAELIAGFVRQPEQAPTA
jgi:pimeloyl-ACP methyl ester carboxylesterase